MDREQLANWSLDLTDEEFPRALAALGVLTALERPLLAEAHGSTGWRVDALSGLFTRALDGKAGVLKWALPAITRRNSTPQIRVAVAGRRQSIAVPAPEAGLLAGIWSDFIAGFPGAGAPPLRGPRLAVTAKAITLGLSMSYAALLAHPEVGAASVYLDQAFPSDGRTDWRWPFMLAALPDDPLAAPLARLQQQFPLIWPFRFASAGRDDPRAEVLVIGAGASEALARVLASSLRLRCALVVVAGLGTDSARTAEPLLRALVARVSAEGVAVVESDSSPQAFAERLKHFADELTHNKTIDVALSQAFLPGMLLLLNRDLLALSHLDTTVASVAQRLRQLPRTAELRLSARSSDLLGISVENIIAPTPEAIADAIGVARSSYRFDREVNEASAVSELSRSVRNEEAAVARRAAMPRYLHQKSWRKEAGKFIEERSGYLIGQAVMVQIFIGQRRADSVSAPTVFPEDELPKDREMHRLQVVFHEPRQFDQPLLGEVLLPRQGDSSTASFVFTPRVAGAFAGRISILHRGRVLQTVLLRTQVSRSHEAASRAASGISLDDETKVRHDWSDLAKRRQFDLAVVLNHTDSGEPTLTGITGQRAWATNLEGIEQPVRKLNELISAVAHSVADYGDGLDQGENPALLVKLARVGANLYSLLYRDQLKQMASDGLDVGDAAITYLQVVSARPDAVVPLEFMYDFNAPGPDATVCPQHREALENGRCPGNCARSSQPRAYVCPMGFWGLKKVIERHIFDPKAVAPAGAQMVVQIETMEGRDRLDLNAGALVGHSKEVQAAEIVALVKTLGAKPGSSVRVVKDWDEWQAAVKANRPAMLVAFPHNEGKEEDVLLEIGGKKLYTLDLPAEYVHAPMGQPPLVFLLGCDVAGTAQDFSSHIRFFRQAGAAVVVSTIATVFGAHAVRVGEAIVAGLMHTGESGKERGKERIGEVIRDAKRAALLDSVPMALCVVAFGDADWRL